MYYQFLTVLIILANVGSQDFRHPLTVSQIGSKVNLDVYYETHCSDSIALYINELVPIVKMIGHCLDLRTLPYGKAHTSEVNGTTIFKCQHGEKECYGNKLHACAIEHLNYGDSNNPAWMDYNACLMAHNSDDASADICGNIFNVDSAPIKACAKGDRGTQLLIYYGVESGKVHYSYIPHVVINGKPMKPKAELFESIMDAINIPLRTF